MSTTDERLAQIGRVVEQMARADFVGDREFGELRIPVDIEGQSVDYVVTVRRAPAEPRLS